MKKTYWPATLIYIAMILFWLGSLAFVEQNRRIEREYQSIWEKLIFFPQNDDYVIDAIKFAKSNPRRSKRLLSEHFRTIQADTALSHEKKAAELLRTVRLSNEAGVNMPFFYPDAKQEFLSITIPSESLKAAMIRVCYDFGDVMLMQKILPELNAQADHPYLENNCNILFDKALRRGDLLTMVRTTWYQHPGYIGRLWRVFLNLPLFFFILLSKPISFGISILSLIVALIKNWQKLVPFSRGCLK